MPVIRLTIVKPFTSICFSVCSVLVEHCDSWIGHFHPCLGLLSVPSLPSVVCACVHALNSPPLTKGLWPKSDTQTEKSLLSESWVAWLGSRELWIPPPRGADASFPVPL